MKGFSLASSKRNGIILFTLVSILTSSCGMKKPANKVSDAQDTLGFKGDIAFLKKFTEIITLQNASGTAKVAVSPALQGRVMTSTSEGDEGLSYGWINRAAFLSGDTSDRINVFGGEDRIWLGPEGGQFSIYFSKGKEFNLDNWYVPPLVDREPYNVVSQNEHEAVFAKEGELTNYSGTVFQVEIKRKIKIIEEKDALIQLGVEPVEGVSLVAYESISELKNRGTAAWKKESGLLSIWILGMFNPSPRTTILVPYQGVKKGLREIVNDTYFGHVPDDRLKLGGKTIFFKADGQYRSKIGLLPSDAPAWLGSYDSDHGVLTIVKYTKPEHVDDYVNSLWEIQKEPYRGDAMNAYNDGPPAPGAKPLGPFYELESSSPAAALLPDSSIVHIHSTYHLKGEPGQLDPIIKRLFNTSTKEILSVF